MNQLKHFIKRDTTTRNRKPECKNCGSTKNVSFLENDNYTNEPIYTCADCDTKHIMRIRRK